MAVHDESWARGGAGEATDDVRHCGLRGDGLGRGIMRTEVGSQDVGCKTSVSRWIRRGGADEGLEEGDMRLCVGFDEL